MKKEQRKISYSGDTFDVTGWFLTILFCTLRACDVIDWNWFMIMLPIFASWVSSILCAVVLWIIIYVKEHSSKRGR